MGKGSIIFLGAQLSTGTVRVKPVADLAAVSTLKGVLAGYSDCDVLKETFTTYNKYVVNGAGLPDKRAVITCQDANDSVHKWQIPGWNGTTLTDKEGEYVDPTVLATIVSAFATATGLSLTPLRSPVIQTA